MILFLNPAANKVALGWKVKVLTGSIRLSCSFLWSLNACSVSPSAEEIFKKSCEPLARMGMRGWHESAVIALR